MQVEHAITSHTPLRLLQRLFPYDEQQHTRSRDLKVLGLGLGRTGTDSLRTALLQLGYDGVYHGFVFASGENKDGLQWERLHRAKFGAEPNPAFLNRQQFDAVLGDYEAVTDAPGCLFAIELLQAYPDAKVVLSYRKDVNAWYRSYLASLDKIYMDWPSWSRQWFDNETFWIVRALVWLRSRSRFDFKKNGKAMYRRHYEEIEAELRLQGRESLYWEAKDGWEPLCRFLGMFAAARCSLHCLLTKTLQARRFRR